MHHTPAMIRTSFLSAGLLASPLLFAADSGWPDQVAVSGTIESALGSSTDYNDDTGSGIDVPTVELVFDAVINPRVSANLGFKYEEGKTDFGIDTAYIDYRIDALTLTMGRVYLPFGSYETQQITGTLPSEIGEARHSVGMASYGMGPFSASAYIFNGVEDKPDTEDVLSVYGLSLDMDTGLGGLGVDYVTDLSESMGVLQTLQDSTLTPLDEHPGISVKVT